jgi:hypothetical protein
VAFAEHQRRLDQRVEGAADGGTQRAHLAAAAAAGNAGARRTLALHPCPPVFRALWRHFQTLSLWRGASGMGPSPLTLHDVREYETRFGCAFLPGELLLLKRLDSITLGA